MAALEADLSNDYKRKIFIDMMNESIEQLNKEFRKISALTINNQQSMPEIENREREFDKFYIACMNNNIDIVKQKIAVGIEPVQDSPTIKVIISKYNLYLEELSDLNNLNIEKVTTEKLEIILKLYREHSTKLLCECIDKNSLDVFKYLLLNKYNIKDESLISSMMHYSTCANRMNFIEFLICLKNSVSIEKLQVKTKPKI